MEFYISPQSGQFYMINVLENQWLTVTYSSTSVQSAVRNNNISSQSYNMQDQGQLHLPFKNEFTCKLNLKDQSSFLKIIM